MAKTFSQISAENTPSDENLFKEGELSKKHLNKMPDIVTMENADGIASLDATPLKTKQDINIDLSVGEKEFDAYLRNIAPITAEELNEYQELSAESNPITGMIKVAADAMVGVGAYVTDTSPLLWSDKLSDDMYNKMVYDPMQFREDHQALVDGLREDDFMREMSDQWGYAAFADNPNINHDDGALIDKAQGGAGSFVGMVTRDAIVALGLKGITGGTLPMEQAFEISMSVNAGIHAGREEYAVNKNMDAAVNAGVASAAAMGIAITIGAPSLGYLNKAVASKFLGFTVTKAGGLTGFVNKAGVKLAGASNSLVNRAGLGFVGWDATYQKGEDILRGIAGLEPKNNYNAYDAMVSYGTGAMLGGLGWMVMKSVSAATTKFKNIQKTIVEGQAENSLAASKDKAMLNRAVPEINESASLDIDILEMRELSQDAIKRISTGELHQADAAVDVFNKLGEGFKSTKNFDRLQRFFEGY